MRIVFLMTRLSGYFFNCFKILCEEYPDVEIKIIAYPKADNAPFKFELTEQMELISREEVGSISDVVQYLESDGVLPELIYTAGWKDALYRKVARKYKKKDIPVVLGMDNQWKNKWKQRLLTILAPLTVKQLASYIMIPGLRQYDYARKLGFRNEQIIKGLYTADTDYFWTIYEERSQTQSSTKKNIVFIGNVWQDKGIIELVEAFAELSEIHADWTLTIIGGGPLIEEYQHKYETVKLVGFVQPTEMKQYLVEATAFCLPSYHDAWAVVIHEAACAGLPIIATNVCGAVEAFVHDGYNGFLCEAKSQDSLKKSLEKVMTLDGEQIKELGSRSYALSKQLTPQLWANNIMRITNL